MNRSSRRSLLRWLGCAGLAAPFASALAPRRSQADGAAAKRILFFYFPDGVPGPSADGAPSLWHAQGSETSFQLGQVQAALAPLKDRCLFLNGLSLGGTDEGSHPGGAKKLLTGVDGGNGRSIDRELADAVGGSSPFSHVYLGAQANANGASGDKHISYVAPGQSVSPEDDPRRAFDLLFGGAPPPSSDPNAPTTPDPTEVSVIDGVLAEMNAMRAQLGTTEKAKLDLHLEALREVEQRIKNPGSDGGPGAPSCSSPDVDTTGIDDGSLFAPEIFPAVLRAQSDLMIASLACGLTKVGVLQASQHTSELIMSRFAGTPMHDPSFDMRSHQASHYGPSHDPAKREFEAFVQQRTWWVEQFAYLLDRMQQMPEGESTMLDHSIVVLCTEVCDGNTHLHQNMPVVVAGGAEARLRTGRLVDAGGRRMADLWVALANAMGHPIDRFGDVCDGALPGVLG